MNSANESTQLLADAAPHGMDGGYGLQPSRWTEDDPAGMWVMYADKGLPIYFHPDTTYIMTVR